MPARSYRLIVSLALSLLAAAAQAQPAPPAPLALVNINTAGKQELEGLPGVQAGEAEAIIKGRPYRTTDEILRKKIVPPAIYEAIKGRIIAD